MFKKFDGGGACNETNFILESSTVAGQQRTTIYKFNVKNYDLKIGARVGFLLTFSQPVLLSDVNLIPVTGDV